MFFRKHNNFLVKLFSLFSVVRGYNIAVVVVAQYLASIFIFAENERALTVLLDWRLFLIVLSTSLAIASGYIINNFYDTEKDLINRPNKSALDRQVSRNTQFQLYFALNFLSAGLAWVISWRAALFFSVYIFLLWLYSHKFKKFPIIGNVVAAILVLIPFFGILIYFQNYSFGIFVHAAFLFLLIWIREIIKDLENLKGDFANNYATIPVRIGVKQAKWIITVLTLATLLPARILIDHFEVGYMAYYFYFSMLTLLIFLYQLWLAKDTLDYHKLHISLKLLILLGVLSIVLINPRVILHGKQLLQPLL